MGRRTFRYAASLGQMVEVVGDAGADHGSAAVQGDLTPFISVVDGTLISSKSQLREYMAKKSLVHFDPTQKAEVDRYQEARETKALRERIWEGVSRTFSMGNKPR